jgi:hypothetical protein
LSYLLFFVYLIALSWCLLNIRFISESGLNKKIVILLFVCKVAAGLISGRISQNAPSMDTWKYHEDAKVEYQLLFDHPSAYFTNIFNSGYADPYAGVLKTNKSYWNDLKTNLIVKFISVLDIFSGANYYVNVVLFNFLVFLGNMALFRVYCYRYKHHLNILAFTCFLLPSFLLFSSTIHKEGLIIAALGWLLYSFYNALNFTGFTPKKLIGIVFCFLVIFLFRNYVAVMLLPGLAAWAICHYKKYTPIVTFSIVYLLFMAVFFNIHTVFPAIDPPGLIVQKQSEFFGLEKARSQILTPVLYPDFSSFVTNFPATVSHIIFRPFLTDYKLSTLLLPFSIELACYQVFILLFVFIRKKKNENDPFVLFGLFFAFSLLLIIGYIVPVIWAIVRYRSIYLPFILIPVILNIDWEKLTFKKRSKK